MQYAQTIGIPRGRFFPLGFGMYTRRSGRVLYPRCCIWCMAIHLLSGSFQVTLSTPGVFLPGFSVTRLTARALPLNEWVSRCCKACTLCHLPTFVACTIRACSRRTCSLTIFHGMECQSVRMWETAPAEDSAVICIASWIGSSRSLVHPHRREVSPLARRVMLQPVSAPLQDGIRFFPPPYPHAFGWPYDLPTFSRRGNTGLPRSTRLTRTGEVL